MVIAVVNLSKSCKDSDVDFWASACNDQLFQACKTWGITPTPVLFFRNGKPLPPIETRIMAIVDTLDVPGALGYHTDAAGDVYGRIMYQGEETSITLSHECLEEVFDPTCDGWFWDGSRYVAKEPCDPVEGDWYEATATVAGEARPVKLSNYILPAWWTHGGQKPFDIMGRCTAPFQMTANGYMVVQDTDGEHSIFARHTLTDGRSPRMRGRSRPSKYIVGNPPISKFMACESRTLERLSR